MYQSDSISDPIPNNLIENENRLMSIPNQSTKMESYQRYEFHDYQLTWNDQETSWVSAEAYIEPLARSFFWQQIQPRVEREIQPILLDGWEAITEMGPSGIEMRHYKSLQGTNWGIVFLWVIISFGLFLFYIPFMGSWKFGLTGFHMKFRRPINRV